MKNTHLLTYILFLPAFFLWSCEKDDDQPGEGNYDTGDGEKIFIVNEGNFGSGNASLSYYLAEKDTVIHNHFKNANGEPLGDVFQSIAIDNALAFLVVNNSGKIEVIDPATGLRQGKITGLTSPRYMATADHSKGYVSDLFANGVSIIDLEQFEVSGKIAANGWTEGIIAWRDKIYVTGMQSGYLYEIDPETDAFTDSIMVGPGPESMVTDHKDNLWLLAGGSPLFKEHPRVYEIDRSSLDIITEIELNDPDMLYSNLSICPQGKTLYFLGGNIYTIDISQDNPEAELFIDSNGRFFYGLSVDTEQGDIYVADPIDFVQAGNMLRYDPEGNKTGSWQTGIIPSGFAFY